MKGLSSLERIILEGIGKGVLVYEEIQKQTGLNENVCYNILQALIIRGLVKTDGIRVIDYIEKPINISLVNAGIYCLNPKIIDLIDAGKQFDMSELIVKCLDSNFNVGVFLLYEKWIDIGRQEDFQLLKSQGDL